MSSSADNTAPARESEVGGGSRSVLPPLLEGRWCGMRRLGDIDACPVHRKHWDNLCALTGYKLEEMCKADLRDLFTLGDAITKLDFCGRDIPDDGYGHPDLITIKEAIGSMIKHSTALANRKKQREQAVAEAAQEETQEDESEAGHSDKENVPPLPTTRRTNPHPTATTPAEGQKNEGPDDGKTQPGTSTVVESDAAAPMVDTEPAGPSEAPKIPATWVERMKAKVSVGAAKAKRVRNMIC